MAKIYITLFITIFLHNNSFSQTILNLQNCITILEKQNEDIRQANIDILLSDLDIKEAKNAYLPTVQLSIGNNYNFGLAFDQVSGQLVTGDKWSNNANAQINTRIPIFQGFILKKNLKNSLLNFKDKEIQKKILTQSLKLELLSKYFEVIANNSLYIVSLEQLSFAKKQLQQELVKSELFDNTLVDITQAESQVANSELTSILNLTAYTNSLISLKQLLGISLSDSIALVTPNNLYNTTISELLNNTSDYEEPNIQLAHNSLKKIELELHYEKKTYYPSIFLFSGYGTNYSSERKDYVTGEDITFFNQLNKNKNFNFGLSLSIPLFDGFKSKNNINRLKLDLNKKQSELKKIIVENEKIIEFATQELKKSIKEFQVIKVKHSALEKSYLAIYERYKIGVNTSMDYNKALLEYNISTSNLIRAKYIQMYNEEVIKVLKGYI